ncbi:hypothetical protein [Microbacterium sp. NPDC089696]|uniref:hypothetical protein n=1 Tax=Microbacterium sp. NPDC089696 TaxID=3364199 RepID=UPI003824F64C
MVLLTLSASALSGCAERVSPPVGVWEASGEDHGTLTLDPDGGFEAADLSSNLLERSEAEYDFNGEGTWRLSADGHAAILSFERASEGVFTVGTDVSVPVDFTSGSMYFVDVEHTASIELRMSEGDD